MALLTSCDSSFFETSHGGVDDGNEAFVAGDIEAARAHYDEAAQELPEQPALNYDRGLATSAVGDHQAAHDMLVRALDAKSESMQQRVRAALGLNAARWALAVESSGEEGAKDAALERWQEAVDHLESALVRDPTDASSRQTLEVALLRVDPPCSSKEDGFEPNDRRTEASEIVVKGQDVPGALKGAGVSEEALDDRLTWSEQLFSCPDNPDWFAVNLSGGDRVAAELTRPEGAEALGVKLYDASGTLLAGDGETPADKLEYRVPRDAGDGVYYVEVVHTELDETKYGLEVVVYPSCHRTEDRFEDNDTKADAPLLTPGPLDGLKTCPGDEDWYSVDIGEGESLFVFASVKAGPSSDAKESSEAQPKEPGAAPPPINLEIHSLDSVTEVPDPNAAPPPAPPVPAAVDPALPPAATPPAPPKPAPPKMVSKTIAGERVSTGVASGQGRISTLLTPKPGRYAIRVWGDGELDARYQLQVQVVPPCPEGDDRFEDNDIVEDAVDIEQANAQPAPGQPGQPGQAGGAPPAAPPGDDGKIQLFARICKGDTDWFKYANTGEQPAIVSIQFEHEKGDLALGRFNATGDAADETADTSSQEQNIERVTVPPQKDDTPTAVTLRIEGKDDAENFYILRVDSPKPQPQNNDQDQDDNDDKDKDDKDKDDKQDPPDQDKQQPPEQDKEPEPEPRPLEEALDKLDRNPENLEAAESEKRSPLANHKPDKDW